MNGQVEGQLTLFPEDFLASRFPLPGSREARKMTATSGRKWLGLSKNSGLLGLLEKMLLESLSWHSPIYYLNWKPVDIGRGYFIFRLVESEPDTTDTESLLWATPNTMDYLPQRSPEALKKQAENSRKGRKRPANLREQANPETVKMWPTPTVTERVSAGAGKLFLTKNGTVRRKNLDGSTSNMGLEATVKMYNTPTAQDAKNSTLPKSQIKRDSLVGDVMRGMFPTPTTGAGMCVRTGNFQQLAKLKENGVISEEERKSMSQGNGGQLNPDWVEWLMGFPIGWTEI